MVIANFRDYVEVLRDVYSRAAMGEIFGYYQELQASGKKLQQQKEDLKQKIAFQKQKISQLTAEIREDENKRQLSKNLKEIRTQKQALVKSLKNLSETDHFNTLSQEAKVGVCSGFLLQTYLTRELLENNPLHFNRDRQGNLIVDPGRLRSSDLFQESVHLRDFVAAYIEHYPEKVKTPGHFKTMLNNVKTWDDLLNYANRFFDTLNSNDVLGEGEIKASRRGTEVIKVWPEQQLQLVRLHTEKALDYESAKMEHCVGRGGYDSDVKTGKKQIYSIRNLSADGEWIPHATIEYSENAIKQIKGIKNKGIEQSYLNTTREAVFFLLGSSDINNLYKDKKIGDLNHLGYVIDTSDMVHDMFNINEDFKVHTLNINSLLFEKYASHISAETVELGDVVDDSVLKRLKNLKSLEKLYTSQSLEFKGNPLELRREIFDLFKTDALDVLSQKIDYPLFSTMGYYTQFPFVETDDLTEYLSFRKEKNAADETWIDIYQPQDKNILIDTLYVKNLREEIDFDHIVAKNISGRGHISQTELRLLNQFNAVYTIDFNCADFEGITEINLGAIPNMYTAKNNAPFGIGKAFFLEEYAVSKIFGGEAVLFQKCKNMPPLDKIKFPPQVKHIMFDFGERTEIMLPDFRSYKGLESIQINNAVIAKGAKLLLPKGLKYLAFYDCDLGERQMLNLAPLQQLEELRLRRCNLDKICSFSFPNSLQTAAFEDAQFKDDTTINLSNCLQMKVFDISSLNINSGSMAVQSLLFPPSIEKIKMKNIDFTKLKELDFGHCQNLQLFDVSNSRFSHLNKIVLPEQTELKGGKFNEQAQVGRVSSHVQLKGTILAEHFAQEMKFHGIKIVHA